MYEWSICVYVYHTFPFTYRIEADGTRTVLARTYQGKRLNSPNDLAFSPHALYFTDPPYGLKGQESDPAR